MVRMKKNYFWVTLVKVFIVKLNSDFYDILCFNYPIKALLFESPLFYYSKVIMEYGYEECTSKVPRHLTNMYNIFIFVFTFVLPLFTTLICYTKIIFLLTCEKGKKSKDGDILLRGTTGKVAQKKKRKYGKMVTMLLLAVLAFVCTTFPNHIFALWNSFKSDGDKETGTKETFLVLHGLCALVHVHGWMNPVIYCIFDQTFRKNIVAACSQRCNTKRFKKNSTVRSLRQLHISKAKQLRNRNTLEIDQLQVMDTCVDVF